MKASPNAYDEHLFSDLPEAIANTAVVSSRLQFTLEDLGYEFPRYPLPPGESVESLLHTLPMRARGVMPDVFDAPRLAAVRSPYLLLEGPLQKYEGVIHVQARKIAAIEVTAGAASSHDFK